MVEVCDDLGLLILEMFQYFYWRGCQQCWAQWFGDVIYTFLACI